MKLSTLIVFFTLLINLYLFINSELTINIVTASGAFCAGLLMGVIINKFENYDEDYETIDEGDYIE